MVLYEPSPTEGECACGRTWDRFAPNYHNQHHREWARGRPVTPLYARAGIAPDGLSIVPVTAPDAAVRFVYYLARTFRSMFHYDHVQFPRRHTFEFEEDWSERRKIAFVMARNGRAIGHVIVCRIDHAWPVDPATLDSDRVARGEWWSVEQAFTCRDAQRQGVGCALIAAAARHHGIAPHQFAWAKPMSAEGLSLARSFVGEHKLWVT